MSAGRENKIGGSNSIFCAMETKLQESWKPLLNTIPALRGSSEWFAQLEFEHNFFSTRRPLSNTLPHPRKEKKCSITCGRE